MASVLGQPALGGRRWSQVSGCGLRKLWRKQQCRPGIIGIVEGLGPPCKILSSVGKQLAHWLDQKALNCIHRIRAVRRQKQSSLCLLLQLELANTMTSNPALKTIWHPQEHQKNLQSGATRMRLSWLGNSVCENRCRSVGSYLFS